MSWAIEEKDYSHRRACGLIGLEPKTYRYAPIRRDDATVRARLRSLAGKRRRFGYRRLLILLRREDFTLNHKTLFRLNREERLSVRRRGGRQRALGTRAPAAVPQKPNQRWSLDFASHTLDDDGSSATSLWSTTARESAWRWWPTRRCLDSGSRANLTGLSCAVASR